MNRTLKKWGIVKICLVEVLLQSLRVGVKIAACSLLYCLDEATEPGRDAKLLIGDPKRELPRPKAEPARYKPFVEC